MATLFTNIKSIINTRKENNLLRGKNLSYLPIIENGYLIVEGANIADVGKMEDLSFKKKDFAFNIDATGKMILPSWCDSHTHTVFSGSREDEFVDKIKGLTYADIAARGGGISASAKRLQEASEEDLYNTAYARLQEMIRWGTGAVEIKSGYGLTAESEIKMLRVIQRLKKNISMPIKATFLGAHTVPAPFKENRNGYIESIIHDMLPKIHVEGLADYIDVFCEAGFFTPAETETICNAGIRYGLKPKIHANQLSVSGGVQAGINVGALSVDHLESMDDAAIQALAASGTIGTMLPTAAFFLNMPYPPARQMIDAGCALALATDFNPGSSPSGNMNFVVALSCIQMKMLPEEAINAATINGAYAMELEDVAGSITVGKLANIILTRPIPSIQYLPYAFGAAHIEKVMLAGEWVL